MILTGRFADLGDLNKFAEGPIPKQLRLIIKLRQHELEKRLLNSGRSDDTDQEIDKLADKVYPCFVLFVVLTPLAHSG